MRRGRARKLSSLFLLLIFFGIYLVVHPDSYQQEVEGSVNKDLVVELKETQEPLDSLLAVDVLEKLAVKEKDETQKYYRKLFYDSWGMDENGCGMREVILKRDLKNTVLDGCKVMSGVLEDPYTGTAINFVRGQDTSSAVQIDHVVALSNAWVTGANRLEKEARYDLSQDPLNLLAVDGPANQQKSDQDAASWLPENENFRCQYVARQISVKYKYKLWLTPQEKGAMRGVLNSCPKETTVGLTSS